VTGSTRIGSCNDSRPSDGGAEPAPRHGYHNWFAEPEPAVPAHVALVNDHRWIDPPDPDDYARRILTEDACLAEALERRGARVKRVDWADPAVDWRSFDIALIRQVWDYFERYPAFMRWLDRVADATRVVNPVDVIRWNAHKRYLVELAAAGVPTVPTRIVERCAEPPSLAELLAEAGCGEAVIKPAVSGAGRETYRVRPGDADALAATWRWLAQSEDMLVQPFMPAIVESGEVSVMVIDGEATHAVRKIAAPGEFRVQDDHGGTVHPHRPDRAESAVAERAIAAVPGEVAYARVDLVASGDGPVVMELELIEPELFFRHCTEAAGRLAARLLRLTA
jgi:glutathione synthase/RimK-type ligase-like ATP-grasp enzyme